MLGPSGDSPKAWPMSKNTAAPTSARRHSEYVREKPLFNGHERGAAAGLEAERIAAKSRVAANRELVIGVELVAVPADRPAKNTPRDPVGW